MAPAGEDPCPFLGPLQCLLVVAGFLVEACDLQVRERAGEVLALDGDNGLHVAQAVRQGLHDLGKALTPAVVAWRVLPGGT